MTSAPITSREYKLTLNIDDKLYRDCKLFNFEHLHKIIEWTSTQIGVEMSGKFKHSEQFTVKYMDTPEQDLYHNGWIFRIRNHSGNRDNESDNEYTLKFRSPDRYYTATRDLDFNHHNFSKSIRVHRKFEEDITLDPFSSNFSRSTTVHSKDSLNFRAFDKLLDGWKGVSKLSISPDAPIVSVGGRKVIQEVWKGVVVQLGDVKVNIKIVLWWKKQQKQQKDLLFGEIMFRIKEPKEQYSPECIVDARNFYLKLNQIGLNTGWVSSKGMTKTKYFYSS